MPKSTASALTQQCSGDRNLVFHAAFSQAFLCLRNDNNRPAISEQLVRFARSSFETLERRPTRAEVTVMTLADVYTVT